MNHKAFIVIEYSRIMDCSANCSENWELGNPYDRYSERKSFATYKYIMGRRLE